RLVDQTRILLWFQTHLSMVGVLAVIIAVVRTESVRIGMYDYDARHRLDHFQEQLGIAALLLVGIAIVAAICGRLLWRGWPVLFVVILATELAAAYLVLRAFTMGVASTVLGILYAGLTLWILVDLFRPEVLRYLFGGAKAARRALK